MFVIQEKNKKYICTLIEIKIKKCNSIKVLKNILYM